LRGGRAAGAWQTYPPRAPKIDGGRIRSATLNPLSSNRTGETIDEGEVDSAATADVSSDISIVSGRIDEQDEP
jgi:hypothetical protein